MKKLRLDHPAHHCEHMCVGHQAIRVFQTDCSSMLRLCLDERDDVKMFPKVQAGDVLHRVRPSDLFLREVDRLLIHSHTILGIVVAVLP